MADFQPRFVDLVRNYTVTTGTGNFVLGATANGYSSFTQALKVGDRFYYSAIGIDRPIEREVGRGTLEADGTISREPISGITTPFTAGIKTLSLIAAAEWFNTVQAGAASGGGGGTTTVTSRTALAAVAPRQVAVALAEPGREGLFVFDGSNLSAKVAADPYQGMYVPVSSDQSGASGAWVRKADGPVQASWFGFADGASSNAARLESAAALIDAARGTWLQLPRGVITMDRRLVFTRPHRIEGHGMGGYDGSAPNGGTVLKFPAGSTGLRVKHGGGGSTAGYCQIANVSIAQTGAIGTTGVASYDLSAPTRITLSSGAGSFANDQIVWLEGAGPSLQVQDRTAAITAGSNVATIAATCLEFIGNPGVYIGQHVDIAGAGLPAGTTVVAWTTTSITLSSSAAATVTAGAYTIKFPLVAEVQSGGGTSTLTIDNPSPCPNAQSVANAVLRHAPAALYSTTKVSCRDVFFGYGAEGLGAFIRGSTNDGSIADNCTFDNCYFSGAKGGVVLSGSDAQGNSFVGCNFAGPEVGVLDMGLLGNYFWGCHWAFNLGIAVTYTGALTNLVSCYLEQGTSFLAPSGAKCAFFNTISMYPRSGWGGIYFSSTGLFTGVVSAQQGAFNAGLASIGTGPASSFYAGGNINGAPANSGSGPGVQIGTGGLGFGNYILSYVAPGSGAYQRLCIDASDIYFGTSAGGSELAKLTTGGVDLPGSARNYAINGTQVVGARAAGWTAATGNLSRGAFSASAAGTASESYAQSELQSALNRIAAIEARVVAYDADLRAHGLIGS